MLFRSLGQVSTGQTSALGQNTASNLSSLATSGANALASGQIGSANALAGGVSGLGNAALLSSLINPASTSGLGTSGTYWIQQSPA